MGEGSCAMGAFPPLQSQSARPSRSHSSSYPRRSLGAKRREGEPHHDYYWGLFCCLRAAPPLLPTSLCIGVPFHLTPVPTPPGSCPPPLGCLPPHLLLSLILPLSASALPALCSRLSPFCPSSTCLLPILGAVQGPSGLTLPASQAHFLPSSAALLFDIPVTGGLEKLRALLPRHTGCSRLVCLP